MDKKFYQKAFNILVMLAVCFSLGTAEANYTIGIVGIESRAKNINLGDYTNLEDISKNPLAYAQEVFEDILTTDLLKLGLSAVDKTAYAKMARESEAEFQRTQELMRQSISSLEKGDVAPAVKLFDKNLDYIIYGYISNLTITHRESFLTSNVTVRVDLTTRIIDASTGKIVCVATGKGESASHGGAYRKSFQFGGKEISEVAWHESLEKALNQVVEKIKKQV